MDFNFLQTKMKKNILITNALIEMTLNSQKAEKQRENKAKVCNLTETNKG